MKKKEFQMKIIEAKTLLGIQQYSSGNLLEV